MIIRREYITDNNNGNSDKIIRVQLQDEQKRKQVHWRDETDSVLSKWKKKKTKNWTNLSKAEKQLEQPSKNVFAKKMQTINKTFFITQINNQHHTSYMIKNLKVTVAFCLCLKSPISCEETWVACFPIFSSNC